jgi:predicted nucleic acid-binding protein
MLYGRIVVPVAVFSEMRHPGAPLLLRRWVEDHQAEILVRSVQVPDDRRLALLGLGEREAIVLAQQTTGSLLIIDDGEGREEARRRGLRITGLLGVIRDAALRGFLDFDEALQSSGIRISVCRPRSRLWCANSIGAHADSRQILELPLDSRILVDLVRFELTTSSMPWKRAPNCATGPFREGTPPFISHRIDCEPLPPLPTMNR